MTAHARHWKKQAGVDIRAQLLGVRFTGTYSLTVKLSDLALDRDRDCDNTLKLMLDAFVKSGAVVDDNHRHLRAVSIEWCSTVCAGTCEVTIAELTPEPIAKPVTAKARPRASSSVPASILVALRQRGINVTADRVHLQ